MSTDERRTSVTLDLGTAVHRALGHARVVRTAYVAAGLAMLVPIATSAFEFELSSLKVVNGGDGTEGVVISGHELPGECAVGSTASGAGDVNGDGLDDVILGGGCPNA